MGCMTAWANRAPVPPLAVPVGCARARGATDPDREDETFLWNALPGRRLPPAGASLVYLPGLGPHSTGRTRLQRALQRLEVRGLSHHHSVWLVGRRSPLGAGTTIASLAADHAWAIRSRFDQPVDVVGESTGGSIALQLALDHPDVVKRLVLVSAASSLERAGRAAQRDVVRSLRAGRPRRAAGILLAATSRRPIRSRLLRGVGFVLGRLVIGRFDDDLIVTIEAEDGFDLRHDLVRVTTPTLLVGGGQDGYYSPSRFGETAALMPNADYIEYPKKGNLTVMADRAVRREIRTRLRPDRTHRKRSRRAG